MNPLDDYLKAEADWYEADHQRTAATTRKAQAILAMRGAGQTWVEIARAVNLTPQRVHELSKYGLSEDEG